MASFRTRWAARERSWKTVGLWFLGAFVFLVLVDLVSQLVRSM